MGVTVFSASPQSKNVFQEEERKAGRRNERKEGKNLGLQTKEHRDDDDCKMKIWHSAEGRRGRQICDIFIGVVLGEGFSFDNPHCTCKHRERGHTCFPKYTGEQNQWIGRRPLSSRDWNLRIPALFLLLLWVCMCECESPAFGREREVISDWFVVLSERSREKEKEGKRRGNWSHEGS